MALNAMPGMETAGSIASGQSLLTFCGREALPTSGGTATFPLMTIPAGRTFVLTDCCLTTISTNEVDIELRSSLTVASTTVTPDIMRAAILSTSPFQACGIESQTSAVGGSVLQLLLPQVAGSYNVDFFIAGFVY